MSSILTELVRKQTATSMLASLNRSIDLVAEEMARELMRDPEFRSDLQQLVRAAFRQTLKELNEQMPSTP